MTVQFPIYLDYNATTPCDPRVVEVMLPYFHHKFGNAASRTHAFGWAAEEAVEQAREQVAALIGASSKEMVWTSGSTESINLAMKGVAHMYRQKGDHIITAVTEHKAVLDVAKRLEQEGFRVTYLPVDQTGRVAPEEVAQAITDKTILVALMAANNEIGTLHPIAEIGKVCKQKGVLFFCDGTQAAGKVRLDVEAMGIDLLCLSGHKMYGPKGVGCLYVRRKNPRVRLVPLIDGGGHERGMRSGTLNVTGIVGMGKAAELARTGFDHDVAHVRALRDRLEAGIHQRLDYVTLNGHREHRLPNTSNLSFAYVEGESLIMGIKDIAVSSGSACTSASLEPSHVLKALGVGEDMAHSSIRFSFGRFSSAEEVDATIEHVSRAVIRLRELSPLYEMVKEGVNLAEVKWTSH
jgi:cysteine desulfurase